MTIGTYDTHTLLGVIRKMEPLETRWLQLFGSVVTFDSEWIDFDQLEGEGRRLAPFVAPTAQGKVMRDQGYETRRFKAAYVKPKHVIDPSKAIKRRPGEALASGSLTPAQRFEAALVNNLDIERRMIIRRMEAMAAEAIRLGQVTVEGEDYPRVVVDFGRNPDHRVVLGAGSRFGEAGVSIVDTLEQWASMVHRNSGYAPTRIDMAPDVWEVVRKDDEVKELLDTTFKGGKSTDLDTGPGSLEGVQYKGRLGAYDLYVYADFYEDDEGNQVDLLPAGELVMTSSAVDGVRCFGAIMDKRAGFQPLEMFPKVWEQEDPSVAYTMTQSAPLMVPSRPDATFSAKVLG